MALQADTLVSQLSLPFPPKLLLSLFLLPGALCCLGKDSFDAQLHLDFWIVHFLPDTLLLTICAHLHLLQQASCKFDRQLYLRFLFMSLLFSKAALPC